MFIKEKRDGTIKARDVQTVGPRENIQQKAETSLPIISLKAMMMSFAIDVKKG